MDHPNQPPPYGPAVPMPSAPTIIVQESVQVGPESQPLVCPNCKQNIVTRTESKATTKTHLYALLLCCCICWPCAWIPYVCDSCQNIDHYCPSCNMYIGTYEN